VVGWGGGVGFHQRADPHRGEVMKIRLYYGCVCYRCNTRVLVLNEHNDIEAYVMMMPSSTMVPDSAMLVAYVCLLLIATRVSPAPWLKVSILERG